MGALIANSGTDALLLGDEGYDIAPWLMTPYKEPLNAPQERSYNCLFLTPSFMNLYTGYNK